MVVVIWNKYGMHSHAERGNEIKIDSTKIRYCNRSRNRYRNRKIDGDSDSDSSFPRSCVGMHI